jgi:hypothetical protein
LRLRTERWGIRIPPSCSFVPVLYSFSERTQNRERLTSQAAKHCILLKHQGRAPDQVNSLTSHRRLFFGELIPHPLNAPDTNCNLRCEPHRWLMVLLVTAPYAVAYSSHVLSCDVRHRHIWDNDCTITTGGYLEAPVENGFVLLILTMRSNNNHELTKGSEKDEHP